MNITMTVLKEDDVCKFFADVFSDVSTKFGMSANPIVFSQRALFTQDNGNPMLVLPLEDAKKMAEEILKL